MGDLKYFWLFLFIVAGFRVAAQPSINTYSLVSDTVDNMSMAEIIVDLNAQYSNPYDEVDILLKAIFTAPSGDAYAVDGFYMKPYEQVSPNVIASTGPPQWRIRFTPREEGLYVFNLTLTDENGTVTTANDTLVSIPSQNRGFLSFNDRYLQFDDGSDFIGVGENIGWVSDYQYSDFDVWTDSLAANNANYIRVWFTVYTFQIEWDNAGVVGTYTGRLDRAWWLDWFLEMVQEKGIYVQLCFNEQQAFVATGYPNWDHNPYNSALGGPCDNTWGFFSDSEAKYFFKRKLRYIVSRWSAYTSLATWELFNEVNSVDGYLGHESSVVSWHNEMALYLKQIDPYKHPIGTSLTNYLVEPNLWALPSLDFTQNHRYVNNEHLDYKLYNDSEYLLSTFSKPSANAEIGPSTSPTTTATLDPNGIHVHNAAWASLFSGTFAASMPWFWSPYIHNYNLYYQFKGAASFAPLIQNPDSFLPVIPETTTAIKSDLVVTPGLQQTFVLPQEDIFTVHTNGIVQPNVSNMATMLYGYGFGNYRNPPHFITDYDQVGSFSVTTGSIAFFSKIKISVDGVTYFQGNVTTNSTYSVTIPQGQHTIFCENVGNGYISIEDYTFGDYRSDIRSYILKKNDAAYGWIQHLNYNYQFIEENGVPQPVSQGEVALGNFNQGYYDLSWYRGNDGSFIENEILTNTSGSIDVEIENMERDIAFTLTPLSSIVSAGFEVSDTIGCRNEAIVFTDTSSGIFSIRKWIFDGAVPHISYNEQATTYYSQPGTYNVTLIHYNNFYNDTLYLPDAITIISEPETPGGISYPEHICNGGATVTVTGQPVGNADYYEWSLPEGCSGNSTSNSISLSLDDSFVSGEVGYRGWNNCGAGGWLFFTINVEPPPLPIDDIDGPLEVCKDATAVYYSVPDNLGASSFLWNTDFIQWSTEVPYTTLNFPNAGNTHLNVKAYNACGDFVEASINIEVFNPVLFAGSITGSNEVYQGQSGVGFQSVIIPNAEAYNWTLPEGFEGNTDSRITSLSFGNSAQSNMISCRGYNVCGMGPEATFFVEVTELPPGWSPTITTGIHTVFMVDNLAVQLDGVPLESVGYAGIFFSNDAAFGCGGAIPFSFLSNYEFCLYADDTATAAKDGFFEGEPLTWLLFNEDDGMSYPAAPTYFFGPEVFTDGGYTVVLALEATQSRVDSLQLDEGWSGISSYIQLNDSLVENLFAPAIEDLVILKNMEGLAYWPPYANTLEWWNGNRGYKANLLNQNKVIFQGKVVADRRKQLEEGWNEIAVLSATPVSSDNLFTSLADTLIILKQSVGNGVFWPEVGVNTMPILNPGEALMAKVSHSTSITFPPDTAWPGGFFSINNKIKDDFIVPSSQSHMLVFGQKALGKITIGESVIALNENHNIIGKNQYLYPNILSMAIYGSDEYYSKSVLQPGEEFYFQISDEDALYAPVFAPTHISKGWQPNGYSIIDDLILVTETGILQTSSSSLEVYPIPAKEKIYCRYSYSGLVMLEIQNINGNVLSTIESNSDRCEIDIHDFPNGVYLLTVISRGEKMSRKFIVLH